MSIKEWPVSIWVIVRDGKPFDYAFSRAKAFADAKRHRLSEPQHFWAIAPFSATLSIKVPT